MKIRILIEHQGCVLYDHCIDPPGCDVYQFAGLIAGMLEHKRSPFIDWEPIIVPANTLVFRM